MIELLISIGYKINRESIGNRKSLYHGTARRCYNAVMDLKSTNSVTLHSHAYNKLNLIIKVISYLIK
jgi:hypothetical protein